MTGMSLRNQPDDAIREQARQWLVRLRSGQASNADAQAFARWRAQSPAHAQAAREVGRLWQGLRSAAANVAREDALSAWQGAGRGAGRMAPGRRAFLGAAVSAGVAWLAFRPPLQLWPSVGELTADYRTGTGEQRELALGAGLRVEMNTQTRINVRADLGMAGAIELVAGEAEVAVESRAGGGMQDAFTVIAGGARLQARAARLNIRHTGGEVQVCCLSGSAELDHPQRRVVMHAAQQLSYDDRTVHAREPFDADNMAWRRGLLLFDDMPLAQVVDEINRYRPGRLVLRNDELGRRRVQAQFSTRDFDEALALIRDLYGAQITYLPGNIVLLS